MIITKSHDIFSPVLIDFGKAVYLTEAKMLGHCWAIHLSSHSAQLWKSDEFSHHSWVTLTLTKVEVAEPVTFPV